MAELYGCDKGVILKYAKKIGYENTYNGILTEENKKEIVALYNYKTSNELAERYGVSRGQITKVWYDNELIGKYRHIYPFNFNYFENINSPDKAYFLGFLAADGNVFKRKNSNSQSIIKLSINEKDKIILEIFKVYLDSQQPIYISERKTAKYISYMSTLELVSDKMAEDLKKYNIIEHKTYAYEMVNLNDNLMSHYFRGYFDGDGSISCSNNKYHNPSKYNISISGFIHNLDKMKQYLEDIGIYGIIVEDKREYDLPFGHLTFTNLKEKVKFINYIYENKRDIYLPRKRHLAESFINAIEQNYSNKINLYNNILMPS